METTICFSCQKPKPQYVCGLCHSPVCKKCAQMLDEDHFSFLKKVPEILTHGIYCVPCFDKNVSHDLQIYDDNMAKAREVFVFLKGQKETRLFKRTEDTIHVKDCLDKEEAMLKLAFIAVQSNFNTLIDVTVASEKVISGAYQTSKWKASGVPLTMDPNDPRILK